MDDVHGASATLTVFTLVEIVAGPATAARLVIVVPARRSLRVVIATSSRAFRSARAIVVIARPIVVGSDGSVVTASIASEASSASSALGVVVLARGSVLSDWSLIVDLLLLRRLVTNI